MGARHAARQLAVQALYALDLNPEAGPEAALRKAREEASPGGRDDVYLDSLVTGAWQRRSEVDAALGAVSRRWKVHRMDRVDVGVLRLATFELMFRPDTPVQVALDEGVELAKEFGTPDSPAFVNGILDRIAREHRKDDLGT
ncbi:MAG: transcription antitermination factor NusB [Deferrisomatales bacterium]|nr:transcription antitermination factor NusB [Deferrisomatales bacterium]